MSSTLPEVQELHDLNIELMETLVIVGYSFYEYTQKYCIEIEEMDSLGNLLERAGNLLERIGASPYHGNPVKSRCVTGKNESPEGNSTTVWVLLPLRLTVSHLLGLFDCYLSVDRTLESQVRFQSILKGIH